MTLNDFINMDFDCNKPIAICNYAYFDEIYDKIEAFDPSWFKDCEFCIDKRYTLYQCKKYLKEDYAEAEVEAFKIMEDNLIVWVSPKKETPADFKRIEHDGCNGCKYEYKTEYEFPCVECKYCYTDKFESRRGVME